jgi:xylulokinase
VKREAFLGIDVGTSSIKCSLVGCRGEDFSTSSAEYPLLVPAPGMAEIDGESVWTVTARLIRKTLGSAGDPVEVLGVGVCAMMIMPVLLDAHRRVVRPIIHWHDERLAAQSLQIKRLGKAESVARYSGSLLTAEGTINALSWVKEHEPDAYGRIDRFVMMKDFVRLKLCGELATDYGDASGSAMLDVRGWQWSTELIDELGFEKSFFPELRRPEEAAGRITVEAAAQTGLKEGTPVAVGTGDGICTILGLGTIEDGDIGFTVGSAGVIGAVSGKLPLDQRHRNYIFCHPLGRRWYSIMATASSGDALRWYRNRLLGEPGTPYGELDREAASVPPGAEGLLFLPYLSGSRNPHSNPDAVGLFIGLRHKHERKFLTRAVLEGILYELRDLFEVESEILSATGTEMKRIKVSGGIVRSGFWSQMLADVLGRDVELTQTQELGAFGSCLLASVAAGYHDGLPTAVARMVKPGRVLRFDGEKAGVYKAKYESFRTLYRQLEPVFGMFAG